MILRLFLLVLTASAINAQTAPWQNGVVASLDKGKSYIDIGVMTDSTLFVCRPYDGSLLSAFVAGTNGQRYQYLTSVNVLAGAKVSIAVFAGGTGTLRNERGQQYRCEIVSQRYFAPSQSNPPEPPVPTRQEVNPIQQAPALARDSSTDDFRPTLRRQPSRSELGNEELRPTTSRNPSEPKIYMVVGGTLIDLEKTDASEQTINGTTRFRFLGTASSARERSERPSFLVPAFLAPNLELYELEAAENGRLLIFSINGKRIAYPTLFSIEPVADGLVRIVPTKDLKRGEYVLSPKGSSASYCFGLD